MMPVAFETLVPGLVDFSITAAQGALRITLIAIAAYVGLRFFRAGLGRLEATLIKAGSATEVAPGATAKRVTTLTSMVRTTVLALVARSRQARRPHTVGTIGCPAAAWPGLTGPPATQRT